MQTREGCDEARFPKDDNDGDDVMTAVVSILVDHCKPFG